MLIAAMLLLLPFVQLGFSYYGSVSTILLLLVVWRWLPQIVNGAAHIWPVFAVALFMPLQLGAAPSIDPQADLLRIVREAVMFIVLISALRGFQLSPTRYERHDLLIAGLAVGALLMATAQVFYFSRGIYFGFPEQFYPLESGTLASDLDLQYIAGNLRPHATFTEPSYLGFALLSLSLIIVPRIDDNPVAMLSLATITIVGLLSRSLAFFLSFAVIIILPLLFRPGRTRRLVIIMIAVAAVPVLIYFGAVLFTRLDEVRSLSQNDTSTTARIIGPAQIILPYLWEYPAGAPWSVIERVMAPFAVSTSYLPSEFLNNAFFNALFLYGVIGLAMLLSVLFVAREWKVRLYLVAAMMFNGSFFSVDKVAIIALTLALYESYKRKQDDGLTAVTRNIDTLGSRSHSVTLRSAT